MPRPPRERWSERINRVKTPQNILGLERVRCVANKNSMKGIQMKLSEYKSYDELPLFLNAAMVAKVLGVSPRTG